VCDDPTRRIFGKTHGKATENWKINPKTHGNTWGFSGKTLEKLNGFLEN
jgi:hypothetical protein